MAKIIHNTNIIIKKIKKWHLLNPFLISKIQNTSVGRRRESNHKCTKAYKITFCWLGYRTSVFFIDSKRTSHTDKLTFFSCGWSVLFLPSFPPTWFCAALVASHCVIYCDMWQPSLRCSTAIYFVGVSCSVKWSFSFVFKFNLVTCISDYTLEAEIYFLC